MSSILVVVVIFGILYWVGFLINKDGFEDFRFGGLTNVMYGLLVVLAIALVANIFK
jgi:FtsH-binding integral membrane protein